MSAIAFIALVAAICLPTLFIAALFLTETPQLWTAALVAILSFLVMRRSTVAWQRLWWWNCAAVAGLWALFELGACLQMGHGISPMLARAALMVRISQLVDGAVIASHVYDNRLDTGASELDVPDPRGCVLFFGCSYTFGEGVGADETFAHLVQTETNGKFRSRNFGVSASAPHYALAQVEDGLVEQFAHCPVTNAVYLVIPHHLVRIVGKWATPFGPRYELQANGELVRHGWLNRSSLEFVADVLRYSSAVYLAKFGYGREEIGDHEVQLTVAVLAALRSRLADRYPGLRFDILYWQDEETEIAANLGRALRTVGAPVHEVAEFMPEIRQASGPAYVEGDHHPSAWAHQRLAAYIVQNILTKPADAPANEPPPA